MPADGLPSVSVIVPVYNQADTLPTTLPALLDQDHPAEIVLVDDGSGDGSGDVLRTLIDGRSTARVIAHEANRGRAAARNTGIAEATGKVLLFLDGDMRPAPDFVRQHALAHRAPGVVGVVSSPVLEGLNLRDPYHRYVQSRRGASAGQDGEAVHFKYFIIGYTSVKAEAVRAVGGFDERFTYGEDIDFAIRLHEHAPGGLVYSARARVHHYAHGTLGDRLRKLRAFGRSNLPLLFEKHPEAMNAANLGFVASPVRWLLRPAVAATLRPLLPALPGALQHAAVRYLVATTIARAYRDAPAR
ncbi:MAG: glycosyltransferase [Bacteroidota bacterium]